MRICASKGQTDRLHQKELYSAAKMKLKSLLTYGGCLAGLFLAGCVTVQPTNSYVRRGPTYSSAMPAVDRIGVLVDAAIAYDRVSTNYFDLEDSLAAITNLVREAEPALKAKGFQVVFIEAPFVGAFKPATGAYA